MAWQEPGMDFFPPSHSHLILRVFWGGEAGEGRQETGDRRGLLALLCGRSSSASRSCFIETKALCLLVSGWLFYKQCGFREGLVLFMQENDTPRMFFFSTSRGKWASHAVIQLQLAEV
jgi:hypothetical protein